MGLFVAVQYGAALSEDLDFVFILKALTAHFVINVISECFKDLENNQCNFKKPLNNSGI